MRLLAGVVLFLFLVGCLAKSMSVMRKDGIHKNFYSESSAVTVSRCITLGWQDQDLFGVTPYANRQRRSGGGYTVMTMENMFFVDVIPVTSRVRVNFYNLTTGWISCARMEIVEACL